jgi:hypothetical protein
MQKKGRTTRTINPLPFLDLDPHRFEDLVRNLLYDFKRWRSIEATGKAGSDQGFDVRAWEEANGVSNVEEDDEISITPVYGHLWKIQCKREKQIGPTKIKAIINEGVDKSDPPYGYVLVAPTTFSKRSYDVFRTELRARGVMEFHLWGKSELEDMLFFPKNDSILFAFFGISLITKKRSRGTEIKFLINNKNRLLKIFNNGSPQGEFYKAVLARDSKGQNYPWKTEYTDFDQIPRWKEYTATECHPLGLLVNVAQRLAFVDIKTKRWDAIDQVNLIQHPSDDREERKEHRERLKAARLFWRYLPRANQANLNVKGLIHFEDILAIDDRGDSYFSCPHIFVDFKVSSGPFRWFYELLTVGREEMPINLAEYKRIRFFPKVFPAAPIGQTYREPTVEFDSATARQFGTDYFVKSLFDISGRYAFLKKGDRILLVGVAPLLQEQETFLEITYTYKVDSQVYLMEHPGHRHLIENQIGRKLAEHDVITILEFDTLHSWEMDKK